MIRILPRRRRPEFEVWAPVRTKSSKPHLLVMPANCGNPDCACQEIEPPEVHR